MTKDFTRKRDVNFTIDDDLFEGVPGIPASKLVEYASMTEQLGENVPVEKQNQVFGDMIRLMLKPDSAAKFVSRMADGEHPIGIDQVMEVTQWLLEQYGMRPTQPSSGSSTGQPAQAPGTSLTDASPSTESTSTTSPPTAS